MNKLTKILLGAGAFLVMSGGLLALTGWATGADTRALDWAGGSRMEVTPVSTPDALEYSADKSSGYREATAMEPFSKVEIDLDLGDVQVQRGDSFGVYLSWNGRNYELDYEVDGDTLKVFSKNGRTPSGSTDSGGTETAWNPGNFYWGGYDGYAAVYVPENWLEELTITNHLGDVDLSQVSVESLSVVCSLGDIYVTSVTAQTAVLKDSMGDISCSEFTVANQLELENSMGSVTLDGDLNGQAELEVRMGDLDLYLRQGEDAYSYDIETDMGTVTINGDSRRSQASRTGGANHLELENNMGDITVEFGT